MKCLQPCALLSRICCGGPAPNKDILKEEKTKNLLNSTKYFHHMKTGVQAVQWSLGNLGSLKPTSLGINEVSGNLQGVQGKDKTPFLVTNESTESSIIQPIADGC